MARNVCPLIFAYFREHFETPRPCAEPNPRRVSFSPSRPWLHFSPSQPSHRCRCPFTLFGLLLASRLACWRLQRRHRLSSNTKARAKRPQTRAPRKRHTHNEPGVSAGSELRARRRLFVFPVRRACGSVCAHLCSCVEEFQSSQRCDGSPHHIEAAVGARSYMPPEAISFKQTPTSFCLCAVYSTSLWRVAAVLYLYRGETSFDVNNLC